MATTTTITGKLHVSKADEDRHLVFGWASVAADERGHPLVDLQGDVITPEELEGAAYEFVRFYRDGGEMHERLGVATLVESMVFTPEKLAALGLPADALPTGWWIGFLVLDDGVWAKVKSGEYAMFSIEGTATRAPI